jgi:hypothetical protein
VILTLNAVRINMYLVIVTVMLVLKFSLSFAFVVCKHVIAVHVQVYFRNVCK